MCSTDQALALLQPALAGAHESSSNSSPLKVTEAHSKFIVPPLDQGIRSPVRASATLLDQSHGLSPLVPATDQRPATTAWRSTLPLEAEAVRLYQEGHSLAAIRRELGIAWDSVARLLDRAGVRERKNKSR